MGRILAIGQLTFLEARRRKIVPAVLGCAALFLLVYGIALHFVAERLTSEPFLQRQAVLQIITLAGLYVANFLTIAVAVLLPVDTLSGEIASGVMQTLASKPLHRAEIVLGKWLAFLAMCAVYLAFTAGGVLVSRATSTNPCRVSSGSARRWATTAPRTSTPPISTVAGWPRRWTRSATRSSSWTRRVRWCCA